jgi:CDP-glucose 4,6-dehydratase
LDPLLGYLKLAERLSTGSKIYEGGWNFGPAAASEISVQNLLNLLVKKWGQNSSWESDGLLHPYEANYLKLDCSKSQMVLKWHPRIDLENSINLTIDWYKAYQNGQDMRKVTSNQIDQVLN